MTCFSPFDFRPHLNEITRYSTNLRAPFIIHPDRPFSFTYQSTEQQAHDQLVNSQDKRVAFDKFITTIHDRPQVLSTLHLKTSTKTCSAILGYLATTIEQKNYNHVVPIFHVLQRLLHFETFYRDFSKLPALPSIISALQLTSSDDCIEQCLNSIELMVKCQVFNRVQGGCLGSNAGGVSNLSGSGSETANNANTDPKLHTFESAMKTLLCSPQNNLPRALSTLFTHYVALHGNFTPQQHTIVQTILRLLRHFMLTTIKTSTFSQISALFSEFRVHTESIIALTVNTHAETRFEAALLLRQFLIHSSTQITTEIQFTCLNKGYLLWYVYIALSKEGLHDNIHKDWDNPEHNKLYSDLVAFLADENETITRLLYRMIPKCIHDNAKAGAKQIAFNNFLKQQFLSTVTPEEKKSFESTTFARYLNGFLHSDWVSVFAECSGTHSNPLIVWNKSDKAELIEVLLNENCDFNLQLELSPSSSWDHDGFEVDYSNQSKFLVVNRYYLHLLLPHYEQSEPKEITRSASNGAKGASHAEDGPQRKPKKIGNRPTALESADGLFVPTKFKDAGQDPYVISHVDLQNFMAACFQRAVVEDDVGWKLACLRMMTTLYIHHSRILQEANMMPYLIWLLTPKTATGTLFDVNEATSNVFDSLDYDNDSDGDDEGHKLLTHAVPPQSMTGLVQNSSFGSSNLPQSSSHKPSSEQSHNDPNTFASRVEMKLEKEISHSLASSFNNPRWRDQIIKFLGILFEHTGNINKFVAGNGINTLIFFINNVHRQNHNQGLAEFRDLYHDLSSEDKARFGTQNGINIKALDTILSKTSKHQHNHHHEAASPQHPQHPQDGQSDPVKKSRRVSVPGTSVPTSIAEGTEPPTTAKLGLTIQVDVDEGVPSATKFARNQSDFHAHSPLHRSASNTPIAIAGSPQWQEGKAKGQGQGQNRPMYDDETSPVLSILDPLWHHTAISNQQMRDLNPIKKIDLLSNTSQPDEIVEVGRKSLNLLLKIVTNAPRLRKKIFKPRVLSSLVQLVLLDDKDMVDTALKILIILIDANTHVIPNLVRTGVFLFLLYAMRINQICTSSMIEFVSKYHAKQNVPYLNRGQSVFQGLFPDPMINLSLQPNGGEHFCHIITNATTISHHILWDKSHKEVLSTFITFHLAPFIHKLTKYPFSTYIYPHDGNNLVGFKLPPLFIQYRTIQQELFVGNIYVRLFNIETNCMNQNILNDGKIRKIQLFHESAFLLSLLKEFTSNSKYFSTRSLTLLDHIQQLQCTQPKSTTSKDRDAEYAQSSPNTVQSSPIIFFTDVEFTTPTYPEVKQRGGYQKLYEKQKLAFQQQQEGSSSPTLTPSEPPVRPGSSSSIPSLALDSKCEITDATAELSPTEVLAIQDHLEELVQALSVLVANNPQDDDVSHFKYSIHLLTLLASLQHPFSIDNRLLLSISHILRALLVIPNSPNAQTLVNNGALKVILRVCVAIAQHISSSSFTTALTEQGKSCDEVKNPYDFVDSFKHNDNIDLLNQYFHIFTALVLNGRSSHKPGPYVFQLTNMFLDEAQCFEFFNTVQSILTITPQHIPQRQYLVASTLRLLQAFSTVNETVQVFQQDNIVFLQDSLKSVYEIQQEVFALSDTSARKTSHAFLPPSTALPTPPAASPRGIGRPTFSQPSTSTTTTAATTATTTTTTPVAAVSVLSKSIPTGSAPIPPPDLATTGAFTPHRYILQHGLILDALRLILTLDDHLQLTVHSIGGVINQATENPAYLGKTPTKNLHVANLMTAYPSSKRVFPASVYLDEVVYEALQNSADPSKFNQTSPPPTQTPNHPNRQLARTNRVGRGSHGVLLDPRGRPNLETLDDLADNYRKETGIPGNGGNRGTLMTNAAFTNSTFMHQPQLKDFLYAPLNEPLDDVSQARSAQTSPTNALVLKQRGSAVPSTPSHSHSHASKPSSRPGSASSSSEVTPQSITTLKDALRLHALQLQFIPCTITSLQHERSFAIRKEAVVLAALLLSHTLPGLLVNPTSFQSNTYKYDPMFIEEVLASTPSSASTDLVAAVNKDQSDRDEFSVTSGNNDPKTLLPYRHRMIETALLSISQSLVTPGAIFYLALFQPHIKYFMQPTSEYFAKPSLLISINAHCSVPIEYKQFVDAVQAENVVTSPTFIWNKSIHFESVQLLKSIGFAFNFYNPENKSKTPPAPSGQAPAPPTSAAPFTRRPTLTKQPSGTVSHISASLQCVTKPGQWNWVNQLLQCTPTSHPHSYFAFPHQLTILSNEIIIEGVFLRVWYAQQQQQQQQAGNNNTTLLPKPLTSTHLFNHICFVLHRYALLAPQRLPTATSTPSSSSLSVGTTPTLPPLTLSPTSIDAVDTSVALDVGYIRKTTGTIPEGSDQVNTHYTTILLDDNSVIDFTTPITQKLFNTSYLPPTDQILTSPYSANVNTNTTDVQTHHHNNTLLALCLQMLSTDRQCEVSKLIAPLSCNPTQSIEGGQFSGSSCEYFGLYQLLSLLACERTHSATINSVCTVLYCLQRDVVEEKQITSPNISAIFDLSSKQLASKFNFSVAHDIVSACCHYLLSFLVKPYQASDLITPCSAQSSSFRQPGAPSPGARRDFTPQGGFFGKNDPTPVRSASTSVSSSPTTLSSYLASNPHSTPTALSTLHTRSHQRVHVMLVLNILYNLIMSQTLLRRGKVLETLFKTGIVATMLNIVFRPISHTLDAKDDSGLHNFTISTAVPMKSLYNTQQRENIIPPASADEKCAKCALNFDNMSQLTTSRYFPFSDEIDTCPTATTPLPIPASIPVEYEYGKAQNGQPSAPASAAPVRRFTVTSTPAPNLSTGPAAANQNSQISNHPFNTANNTYSSAQRLFAAKILGLLFIHPIASPYFRSAIATLLSPQFFTTMPLTASNPLYFLSQLYTEAATPAFSWNALTRFEASKFVQTEAQNLFYNHIQLNRFYAQFLYLSEQKAQLDRVRDHELLSMRKQGELDEDQIINKIEEMEKQEFASIQAVFTAHYNSLYNHHVLEYTRHITYVPVVEQVVEKADKPASSVVSKFGAPTVAAPAAPLPNKTPIVNAGLPILTTPQVTQAAISDSIDAYYGVFQFDLTQSMYQGSASSKDDEHGDELTHFPTNRFQGTLTFAETAALTLASRFNRFYLTQQIYVPVDNDAGLGIYLANALEGNRLESFSIGDGEAKFMAGLVNQTVDQMGKVSGLKQFIKDAEQLHSEAMEDGYIDEKTGVLKPVSVVAQIRRDQLYQIHLAERQRRKEEHERLRQLEIERQLAQQIKPKGNANRRTSTLTSQQQNLNSSQSASESRPRPPAPPTPSNNSTTVSRAGSLGSVERVSTTAGGDDPIAEEIDDENDFSLNQSSDNSPLDPSDLINNLYTDAQLYAQVVDCAVTRPVLFDLYHSIHIESTILQRMVQTIAVLLQRDDKTTISIAKFLNVEDKMAKICEFILLECENEQTTFAVDEQLYFQAIAHSSSTADAIAAGCTGPDPKTYYPLVNPSALEKDVFEQLPLLPLYNLETNTNIIVVRLAELLFELTASSKQFSTQSIQVMHKAKVSKWLLPALFLEHDRYEFIDPETNLAKPASQPTVLFPIISLILRIITNHPEHIDDLVNMGCLFYYLNLILQKRHLPANIYQLCLQTVRKVAQRGKKSRSETLLFLVCEFKDILLDAQGEDLECKDLDTMFQEDSPPCPACDRCWDANHRYRLQQGVFKSVLPQLTVRVMTYSPDKGRVYLNSDILYALEYEQYNQETQDYINEDPIVIARIPQSHLNEPEPQDRVTLPAIARQGSTASLGGDKDTALKPTGSSHDTPSPTGIISTLEDCPPSDSEHN